MVDVGAYRCPSYLPHRKSPPLAGLEGATWVLTDYCLESLCVVEVHGTEFQHELLRVQKDAIQISDMDGSIGNSDKNILIQYLQARNCPSDWIVVGQSYREFLRILLKVFDLHNRIVGAESIRVNADRIRPSIGGIVSSSTKEKLGTTDI
jgi:hypothetical protein